MENRLVRNTALVVVTMASFVTPFLFSCLNVALPSIGKEFSLDAVMLSWVMTSYSLASAVFLVPFGRLADIYGRRKIFTYGTAVTMVASVLLALSNSTISLISFLVVQGIGNAMTFGTAVAILTSVFPPQERGKVLGINVAAVYIGLSAGPYVGGLLTEYIGWRSIFWTNASLSLVILALILWKVKTEWAEAKGEKFDFTGSLIYGAGLIAIMYGLSKLPAIWAAGLILVGLLGIFTFIKWEGRVKSPVFNISLFRNNTVFTFSNLAALINYSATSGVNFLLTLFLQQVKGLSPASAGLVLFVQPIVMAVVSPLAGWISDKIEPRLVASIGMALSFLGLMLLVFLRQETPLMLIVPILLIMGLGFALFSSPNTNAVMGAVEKRYYGVASATLGTMRLVGQMLSMGIVMLMFVLYMGRTKISPEYFGLFLSSMRAAFIIFAVLCFGGIFASMARGRVRRMYDESSRAA
jgi:EmrB/QacA subfamily drug resistance transporter